MPAEGCLPFAKITYQRADFTKVSLDMRHARLHLRLALNPAGAVEAVREMQVVMRHYQTMASLAQIRHDQQTGHPYYAAEQAYYDQADAQYNQQLQQFYAALLNSRYRPVLEKTFGTHIFIKAENHRRIVQPEIVQELALENQLISRYEQRMAGLSVDYQGQSLSLAQLEPYLESPDRMVRQSAHLAMAQALQTQSGALDQLFDQLSSVRQSISRKLGFTHFTDLGYRRMERFDYRRDQIEHLRENILRYIVPVTQEIRRLQKRRLKLDRLYYYDLPCLFPEGNPKLQIRPEDLAPAAGRVMSRLTGQDPSFLQIMVDGGYLDVAARPEKVQGGYCETLYEPAMPFILLNAAGTAQDVSTLVHETGHAYAALCSLKDQKLLEYHHPTLETCEIHSTAMEYLTYPYMDVFFGAAAPAYRQMHLTQALLFLPYGCLVDEFQHRIYDEPQLSAAGRNQIWLELEKKYQPDLDYEQAPFFSEGRAWQKKEHVYTSPFYYIDYVLAQLAALDLWRTARSDAPAAWAKYDRLCGLGGTDTFLHLLQQAGLPSPFDTGTIKRLAYAVCDELSL
ncbi:MAG: M3 family oligoendopeptidase [Clostridiaceae bacterium]|nr:M3 family oligoendopeptidase [Clostridiaceae bacterium]